MPENNTFRPRWASAPGTTISDILRERSLTNTEFAQRLGLSLKDSQDILDGTSHLTSELARQLQSTVGGTVKFWLNREIGYRTSLRRNDPENVWLKELPLKEMVEAGWVAASENSKEMVRRCLKFFDVEDVSTWSQTYQKLIESSAFRTSPTFSSRIGPVAAWLRQGEIIAGSITCDSWNKEKFKNVLTGIRGLTRKRNPDIFLSELRERCASCGVAVVVVKAPRGCSHSGATRFIAPNKAVLQLSFRYLMDDHFWFTFFHESGHILLHNKNLLFLDGAGTVDDQEEFEANTFAATTLIPEAFKEEFLRLKSNKIQVMRFAKKINISPGIVVGQLQHFGRIPQSHLNGLKKRYTWR